MDTGKFSYKKSHQDGNIKLAGNGYEYSNGSRGSTHGDNVTISHSRHRDEGVINVCMKIDLVGKVDIGD